MENGALGLELVGVFLRQAWAEFLFSLRARLEFRVSENARAVRAYCAMSAAEFSAINARQRWANWRVVPRSLRALPDRPCRAVDLCSGVGDSTEVLARCLPPGSEILGLEYNPEFVRTARERVYRDAAGAAADVSFRAQSVLEPFDLPDASVDVVNSCGCVGIHFDAPALDVLAAEIARVLKPGGLAAIDSPARGPGRARLAAAFRTRGFVEEGGARSCFLDRYVQIRFRRS